MGVKISLSMDRVFIVVLVNLLCNLLYFISVKKCKCWSLGKVLFLLTLTVDVLIEKFIVSFVILPEVILDIFYIQVSHPFPAIAWIQ